MPLHELAYIIRRSVLNLREHPEDIQDQAIVMAQIYLGGKPLINFDPKLDINIFSNWVCFSSLFYPYQDLLCLHVPP
ncbi:hypothetical protein FIBSPDRAFT_865281 [Athelia psychrophila]|uniref:Uncharacterized protein n=1 Tax=Athelia psychrophila TaxID=1759441 RepID=A0A166FT01_9AGAM|nr:hypothetical protein FIBSPDRAFT_865281 [Fibularhizoctonia sp. CBS 109695]